MKASFFHDHIFTENNGKYYSSGKLTNTAWRRYTKYCDELIVICRFINVIDVKSCKGLNKTTDEKVKFSCVSPWSKLNIFILLQLKNKIRETIANSDLVVCRVPSVLGFLAFNMASKMNKKIVCEVVGCPKDSLYYHGSLLGKVLSPFIHLQMKKTLLLSNYNIYVTNAFLQDRYPTKGLSCSISNIRLNKHKIRITHKKCVKKLFFIGSLNVIYKGLLDLIKAIDIVNSQGVQLELHVLGTGCKKKYEKLIIKLGLEKYIFFSKPISGGQEVLNWLSEGDIYIQPSYTEGLPRSLIEAMSVGLPCIGTNVGGIPELLDETCLVPPKDPQALAKAIISFINDEEFRKKQSASNLIKSEKYEITKLYNKCDSFLQKNIFQPDNYIK